LLTFEISNLATSVWDRGWGKVAPDYTSSREPPPGRVRAGDIFIYVR